MAKRRLNGEGSYRKRKDGLFEYRYIDNKNKRKSIFDRDLKLLQDKVNILNYKLYKGDINYNKKITIGDIYTDIQKNKFDLNIISQRTYSRNLGTLKILDKYKVADMFVTKATIEDIQGFLIKLINANYSQSTIDKCLTAIKQVFKEAVKYDVITKDITAYIPIAKSNKETKKVKALTVIEQVKLEEIIPLSKYYIQYLIALNTGMRMGEINALQKQDIDLNNKTITINKTISLNMQDKTILKQSPKTIKGNRQVFITDKLYLPLKEYINKFSNDTDFLFLRKDSGYIRTGAINSEFKRLNEKYNICKDGVNVHMLRHSFATRSIEARC